MILRMSSSDVFHILSRNIADSWEKKSSLRRVSLREVVKDTQRVRILKFYAGTENNKAQVS